MRGGAARSMLATLARVSNNSIMGTKGWHDRGYLPHFDGHGISQHVVFRLYDSIPPNEREGDDVLDRHHGSSFMRDPRCARIVAETLINGSGDRYTLQAWCVMPNHVHALVATTAETELGQIVHAWKTITRRRINALLSRTGPVWAKDYFDRFTRNDKHFDTAKHYIETNPVAAGLCATPQDWPFSSAGWK
jgi:REP element-mobilizing transposase RayT